MLRLTARLRELLAEKLLDAGNVIAGAMLFGQFITDRPFSPGIALVGLALWALFTFVAIFTWKETK